MQLANGKSRLEQAMTEASNFNALLYLKETVLAAGIASATTGCILSEEACKPAVRASIALYEFANLADQVGNSQVRAQAQRGRSALWTQCCSRSVRCRLPRLPQNDPAQTTS